MGASKPPLSAFLSPLATHPPKVPKVTASRRRRRRRRRRREQVNAEYGEKADQNRIITQGNMLYLRKSFPHMSYIKTTAVEVVTP